MKIIFQMKLLQFVSSYVCEEAAFQHPEHTAWLVFMLLQPNKASLLPFKVLLTVTLLPKSGNFTLGQVLFSDRSRH